WERREWRTVYVGGARSGEPDWKGWLAGRRGPPPNAAHGTQSGQVYVRASAGTGRELAATNAGGGRGGVLAGPGSHCGVMRPANLFSPQPPSGPEAAVFQIWKRGAR